MIAPGRHGVGDVVDGDLRVRGLEGDDGNLRVTHYAERGFEFGVLGDGVLDGDAGADDGVAGVDVALAADGEERGPAARDEGAGPGAGHGGGPVDAAGPVGGDEVLVRAESGGAVEDDAVAFGSKAVFVGVDGYGGDAGLAEVEAAKFEVGGGEAGGGEEWKEEGTEAAVDMEGEFVGDGDSGEGRDVVDDARGVVWAGSDDEDGVGVDVSTDRGG